ncbi:MAG: T9SS type A sorting domain-containing protein [Bacteroidales bacterium]|nr:T9SS type A sorting domain-containing protein [Bacteroidales bacterium]
MKKILLFLISLMGSTALFGQESITLTFTGQDENQDYVRLNNVVITNLTRGWSDQIVFPDTIYTLNIGVGVEEYAADNEMKVMPNPFDGVTRINLSSAQTEKARLMVVDMQGRLYAQYAGTLTAGDNYFNITLSTPQMYILMVQTPTRRQSLKMVNTGHGGSDHITFSGNLPKAHRLETKGASTRTFFPGDEMRYVGRGQHLTADQPRESAIITQPQNTDETIVLNFVFADGIPCPGMPTVTDHEGNVYNTVQIGSHCWTKENMRCVTSPTTGTYLITPDGTPYTCTGKQAHWVNGDSATYAPLGYGVLYNWNAAVDTFNTAYGELSVDTTRVHPVFAYFSWLENRRGICPEGWHIPSLREWPGNVSTAFAANTGWNSCSNEGTPGYNLDNNNTTGFSALPAGYYFNGYNAFGADAFFWTCTRLELDDPTNLEIPYNRPYIYEWKDPDNCLSVRCVRDYEPNSAPWTVEPEKGTPCPGTPTVTDHEGNVYNTVQIGSQCWTKENMRCRTSPTTGTDFVNNAITYNGNADPHYQIANSYTGKTAHWLNGDSIGHSNLGLLYNWNAAVDTFNTAYGELHLSDNSADAVEVTFAGFRRGICPEGWHIPCSSDFQLLSNYLGSHDDYLCTQGGLNYGKSGVLKGFMGWNLKLGMACPELRNATGFTALPTHLMGTGNYERYCSRFWSSNSSSGQSDCLQIDEYNTNGSVSYQPKISDQSVRCVKDYLFVFFDAHWIDEITDSSAVYHTYGVHYYDGYCSQQMLSKGVCWSTSPMPTYNDSHTDEGSDEGMFYSTLTGLAPSTTYYVRAYALSSTDTVYSDELYFTTLNAPNVNDGQPCQGAPTLTDIDGNVYNTVQIGMQCWMKENLRTTKYPNNTPIMHGNSYSTTDSYWYYPNNSSSNKPTYGLLYTWPAVMNGASTSNTNPSGVQGICPDGWHIPSDAEWNQLLDYAQGIWAWQCTGGSSGKSLASTIGWENSDNACALGNHPEINNASGFGATPSGEYYSGGFSSFGRFSEYWTSSSLQHRVYFQYNQHFVILSTSGGNLGRAYSVRCLRD